MGGETSAAVAGPAVAANNAPNNIVAQVRVQERKLNGSVVYTTFTLSTAGNGTHSIYFSGKNTSAWQAREVRSAAPLEWREETFDLWRDGGAFTLTGLAPTALGGTASFDRMELMQAHGVEK